MIFKSIKALSVGGILFPKGECLSTHRVGPLGLNGFLHLYYCFEFFTPTNRDLYSPNESSLKNSPRGPIGRVLSLHSFLR